MRLTVPAALFLITAGLQAQSPAIAAGGVFNVASYVPAGLPSAAIAQGSLFVIFGTAMGPAALAQAPSLPLGSTLAGTSLTVTVSGTSTKPFLVYTSATQICALLPSATPTGTGTIAVTYNGQTSATQPITVAPASVGIFTVNQAGSGPGIVTNTKYAVNALTTAASAGDVDIIWATGLGAAGSTGSEAAGTAPLAATPSTFKVYVGGVAASIVGAARSSSPGLDQIAFTVPTGVTGCHVPVVVQAGNVVSNFVSMAIGTGGVCSDPVGTGLTPTQLTQLQQQGTVSFGAIGLSRTTSPTLMLGGLVQPGTTTDIGVASFYRYTFQQYTAATGGVNVTTYGACSVYFATGASGSATPTDPIVPTPLDAGSSITVSGPGGSKTLNQLATGLYEAQLGSGASLYLSPGTYKITGPGGKDVGPINTSITLPPTLNWTNASSISTVNRTNGQLVTWTGGDPNGSVVISGSSDVTTIGANNAVSVAIAGFDCIAPDSAGQFTIPSEVLLSMPATPAASLTSLSFGSLSLGAQSALANFSATGLDFGYLSASSSASLSVTYQ